MALTWPTMDEGKWNKVASGVLSGNITRLVSKYAYWATSVLKDATAPIASIKVKSPRMFEDGNQDQIGSDVEIDVYVWIADADTDTDSTGITNTIQVDV